MSYTLYDTKITVFQNEWIERMRTLFVTDTDNTVYLFNGINYDIKNATYMLRLNECVFFCDAGDLEHGVLATRLYAFMFYGWTGQVHIDIVAPTESVTPTECVTHTERIVSTSKVPYWKVGNEQGCRHSPEEYVGSFCMIDDVSKKRSNHDVYIRHDNGVCIRDSDEPSDYDGWPSASMLVCHCADDVRIRQTLVMLLDKALPTIHNVLR